jgi:hypothetical protein
MVPSVDTPSTQPGPEIRGPLVSMLTQLYSGDSEIADGVFVPGTTAAIVDLSLMFLTYVQEAEAEYGGDFLEFLQRQAQEPFLAGG